ncbi:MAG: hypothetical protein H6519_09625 [Microthrixaceae bacterium]|nr:hypothetical protein [Acidimicrobiales bacterium]MCB9404674.1 hypothetical protein [Microthrixaceae bacterium]
MHKRSYLVEGQENEIGGSLVEYALMLALVAVVTFSAVAFFGNGGKGMMGNNANCVGAAMGDTSVSCN